MAIKLARSVSYLVSRVAMLTFTLHLLYYTNWMFMGLASRVSYIENRVLELTLAPHLL